jgi:hypothetical protein
MLIAALASAPATEGRNYRLEGCHGPPCQKASKQNPGKPKTNPQSSDTLSSGTVSVNSEAVPCRIERNLDQLRNYSLKSKMIEDQFKFVN